MFHWSAILSVPNTTSSFLLCLKKNSDCKLSTTGAESHASRKVECFVSFTCSCGATHLSYKTAKHSGKCLHLVCVPFKTHNDSLTSNSEKNVSPHPVSPFLLDVVFACVGNWGNHSKSSQRRNDISQEWFPDDCI